MKQKKTDNWVVRYWIGTQQPRMTAPINEFSSLCSEGVGPEKAAYNLAREFEENGYTTQVLHTDQLKG